jgi:ssDNA-binding replication factor A large subunit
MNSFSSPQIQGIIVDVPKYGLITRCKDCNKIRDKGVCWEHGKVDGKYDLYIEAILFDGFLEHTIMIERPTIEKLFKINLDQCKEIATECLDRDVIREMIRKQMLGRYYFIEGIYSVEGMKVKSIKINTQISRMELLGLYDRWKKTTPSI